MIEQLKSIIIALIYTATVGFILFFLMIVIWKLSCAIGDNIIDTIEWQIEKHKIKKGEKNE